tara:strand:+ start:1627 stop:2868 length:1242 start_codon:yes stop_codon:yes gene_type:complete
LFSVGTIIKKCFNLNSKSIGIMLYIYSFLVVDILTIFFTKSLTFNSIFIFTNALWVLVLLSRLKEEYFQLILAIFPYLLLNSFNNYFLEKLTINNNLIGDVEVYLFEHAKNIYENSFYYSMNNSIFEGYPQYISYFDSLMLRISIDLSNYQFYSSTAQIVFLLSILFFYELKISKENRYLLISIFTLLVINNQFFQFLFTSSLMSEGFVSLFSGIVFYEISRFKKYSNKLNYINFFLLGLLYLTKQFISLIVVMLIIFFLINKANRKFGFIALSGIALQEAMYSIAFKGMIKSHHISQIDIIDTIQDLFTNTNLKIGNILIILQNLLNDKPFSLLLLVLFGAYVSNVILYKKFNPELDLSLFIILINFVFILLLYISVWRNMELESPIRYILNLFHLKLFLTFLLIDKMPNNN